MSFDETLAEKVRGVLKGKRGVTEKKMFGGLCFLLHGNMLCGVEKNRLMVRVGPDRYDSLLKLKHAHPMDFTGKPLKGFLYVSPEGVKRKDSLAKWVDRSLEFAQSLPKKMK